MKGFIRFIIYVLLGLPISIFIDYLIGDTYGLTFFIFFVFKCIFIYLPLMYYVCDPLAEKIYNKLKTKKTEIND